MVGQPHTLWSTPTTANLAERSLLHMTLLPCVFLHVAILTELHLGSARENLQRSWPHHRLWYGHATASTLFTDHHHDGRPKVHPLPSLYNKSGTPPITFGMA
jgi:hypothetical protein